MRTYALKCPSCGGALNVRATVDSFACAFCGANVRVEREGGIVSLTNVIEAMQGVKLGTDRTAAELAIVRLGNEIKAVAAELASYRKEILEHEVASQVSPFTSTSSASVLRTSHILVGIIKGVCLGLLAAALLGFMFASPEVFGWSWLIFTVLIAIGHIQDPVRQFDRSLRKRDDILAHQKISYAPVAADALVPLREDAAVAEKRLEALELKLKSARAIVA